MLKDATALQITGNMFLYGRIFLGDHRSFVGVRLPFTCFQSEFCGTGSANETGVVAQFGQNNVGADVIEYMALQLVIELSNRIEQMVAGADHSAGQGDDFSIDGVVEGQAAQGDVPAGLKPEFFGEGVS